MSEERNEYVSEETGEIIPIGELPFLKMYMDGFLKLRLVGNANVAVLACLCQKMKRNNYVKINRTEISEETGYSRQTVGQAIDFLMRENLIYAKNNLGIINPAVFWRGRDDMDRKKMEAIFYHKLAQSRNLL